MPVLLDWEYNGNSQLISVTVDDDGDGILELELVRHGEWIVQKVDANQTKFYCSKCERTIFCGNDYFMKPSEYVAKIYPYCHCGAKMDKGVKT